MRLPLSAQDLKSVASCAKRTFITKLIAVVSGWTPAAIMSSRIAQDSKSKATKAQASSNQ